MKLGNKPYASSGSVDSNVFRPEGLYATLVARPTGAGTVRLIFLDKYDGVTELVQGAGAIAGLANVDNAFVVTYPIAGAYAGAFLRYTNTSAVAGTCAFSGGSDGAES